MVKMILGKSWSASLIVACLAVLICGTDLLGGTPWKKEQKSESLSGTTWSGTDSDGDDYVYGFEQDGTLSYKSPTGSYKNGKWKQSGNAVYFEMNGRFSEYLGEINETTMKGRAWNTKGKEWTWKATKTSEQECLIGSEMFNPQWHTLVGF